MNNRKLWVMFYQKWWMALWLFFSWYFYRLSPDYLLTWSNSTDFVRLAYISGNYSSLQFSWLLKFLHSALIMIPLPAYKASYLIASVLGGLCLAFLYLLFTRLEEYFSFKDRFSSFLLKNTCLFFIASSSHFLMHSVFFERYLPTLVLFLAFLLSLTSYRSFQNWKGLSLLSVLLVFGIALHWLFLWTGFFLLIVVGFRELHRGLRPSSFGWIFLGLLTICLAFFINYGIATSNQSVDHSYLAPITLFEAAVSYGKSYFSDGFQLSLRSFSEAISSGKIALKQITSTFHWFFLSLAGVGLYRIFVFSKKIAVFTLFFGISLTWPFFFFINSGSEAQAFFELSTLPLLVFYASLSYIAAYFLLSRLKLGLSLLHSPTTARLFVLFLSGIFMIVSLVLGTSKFSFTLNAQALNEELLSQLPAHSLFFCFENLSCSDLLYLVQVENIRSDVLIIPYYYNPATYSLDVSAYQPFGYMDRFYVLHELISTALANQNNSVYAAGVSSDYYSFLGFDLGLIYYIPLGNYGQLSLSLPLQMPPAPTLGLSEQSIFTKNDTILNQYAVNLIQNRLLSANTYFQLGLYDLGYKEMNASSIMAKKLIDERFRDFLSSRNNVEQLVKSRMFARTNHLDKVPLLLNEIPLYIAAGYNARAAVLLRGTLLLDPFNTDLRLKASTYYEQMGMYDLAQIEKKNSEVLISKPL